VREGWNMRAAARRLTVHINTLLYRVGRIERLVGRELDDPDVRLAMAIALRARAVSGSYGSPKPRGRESRMARTYGGPRAAPSLRSVTARSPR
jgi:hypothetical protein